MMIIKGSRGGFETSAEDSFDKERINRKGLLR
jgi:hypothetical protein